MHVETPGRGVRDEVLRFMDHCPKYTQARARAHDGRRSSHARARTHARTHARAHTPAHKQARTERRHAATQCARARAGLLVCVRVRTHTRR